MAAADVERDVERVAPLVIVLVEQLFKGAEPIGTGTVLRGEGVPRPEHRIVQRFAQGYWNAHPTIIACRRGTPLSQGRLP
ncbi:hypothetical protein [Micromonospora sp. DT47]|uniref:hypothetical protein n=1 Tax=Micromonospora sp. DT47 TaxID=3393431 RepID=UPI003CEC094D